MMTQPPKLTESEILARQANDAKELAFDALAQARIALQKQLDPRPLLQKKPIASIVGAAATGFVAALFTIPSRQESELRHLERLHRATHQPPQGTAEPASTNGKSAPPRQTIWSSIVHELVQLIRPIILTAITSSLKPNSAPQQPRQGPDKPFGL